MKNNISNIEELQAEIVRLKAIKMQQEAYLEHQFGILKNKVSKPIHFFQRISGFIPNPSTLLNKIGSNQQSYHDDWLTKGLRIGLPFLVNRVFFRKAGYFKRILMGLLSSQVAGLVNKERLAETIESITSWIRKSTKKSTPSRRSRKEYNFGIPPDSETY
ncbi:hypothetical protein [Olivibacter sp. XZL3]|uniref:hypothetical protein n=1 Tax=Olivibacter sp. XZL3 TaxID=1735116 RepID=UPI001064AB79|nr:hypothetical protein [Olivibacter sp. XZL3]